MLHVTVSSVDRAASQSENRAMIQRLLAWRAERRKFLNRLEVAKQAQADELAALEAQAVASFDNASGRIEKVIVVGGGLTADWEHCDGTLVVRVRPA
jgi:carboxylesterase type B